MNIKSVSAYAILAASIILNTSLLSRPRPSSDQSSEIKLSALGKTTVAIGRLQHPIDEIIHVVGRIEKIVEPWWPDGDVWIDVESVNGETLPSPVNMQLVIMYRTEKSRLAIGSRVDFDAVEIPSLSGNSDAEIRLVENYQAGKDWPPPS